MDVCPTLDLSDPHTAWVEMIGFNSWKGFVRHHWTLQRQGPHQIQRGEGQMVVAYHCGVTL